MERGDTWDERGRRGRGKPRVREVPCSCTIMTVTLIFYLKGLPLQFLRRATTIAGRRMCTTSGVVGKKGGMCVP